MNDLEYIVTNDELVVAIEKTWHMTRNTAPRATNYESICEHLKELLKIQKKRAGLVQLSAVPEKE